jgi:hypothetical protein
MPIVAIKRIQFYSPFSSIAPFMGNFDVSLGGNKSNISYFDNSTHFVCTWNHLYLQDQQEAGPFTFQAILENTGAVFRFVSSPNRVVFQAVSISIIFKYHE